MNLKFKMNYLKSIYQRYHKSIRQAKKKILDEFCNVCNYNRKYAIWLLNNPLKEKKFKSTRKRIFIYSQETISILESIWEASGYLWSQRLKAALPLWLPWAKQKFNITPKIKKIARKRKFMALPDPGLYLNTISKLKQITGMLIRRVSWK